MIDEKIIEDVQRIKYEEPAVLIAKTTEYITAIDIEMDNELTGLLENCEKKEYTCAYECLNQVDILNAIRDKLFELRKGAIERKWRVVEE